MRERNFDIVRPQRRPDHEQQQDQREEANLEKLHNDFAGAHIKSRLTSSDSLAGRIRQTPQPANYVKQGQSKAEPFQEKDNRVAFDEMAREAVNKRDERDTLRNTDNPRRAESGPALGGTVMR